MPSVDPPAGYVKVLQGIVKATFGPGALGRIGTVVLGAVVCLTLLGVMAGFIKPLYLMFIAGMIFATVIAFLLMAFRYAEIHPQFAAMDGAQMTKYLITSVATKNMPGQPSIDFTELPIANPLQALPQLVEPSDDV